jgi:hypothetical protein
MIVTKCDFCGSQGGNVTGMWVAVKGLYDGKHVDAEASVDMCDGCKRNLIWPVAARDTNVRVAQSREKGARE